MTTGNRQLSASGKLSAEEKQRLKAIVSDQEKQIRSEAETTTGGDTSSAGFGWLIRTNAGGRDAELILKISRYFTVNIPS